MRKRREWAYGHPNSSYPYFMTRSCIQFITDPGLSQITNSKRFLQVTQCGAMCLTAPSVTAAQLFLVLAAHRAAEASGIGDWAK